MSDRYRGSALIIIFLLTLAAISLVRVLLQRRRPRRRWRVPMPLLVLAVLAFLVVLGRCGSDGPGGRSRLVGGLHIVNVVAVVVAMFSDYWEVAHDATPLGFSVVIVGLIGFAAAFVSSRAQASLAGLSTFDSWHEIHQLLRRRPPRTYGSRRRHRSRPI